MNGPEVLRIVDAIHRDKNIDKDIVFEGIELAILSAARKHFDEEQEIVVDIDRDSGEPTLLCDGDKLDPDLLGDLLGRVSAQTAKQVMIQKIREAERDAIFEEYQDLRTQLVTGTITRIEHGSAIVNLGKVEAFMPRSEQIPGEAHRVNERIRAIIMDVRKSGSRVKIILSRTHPELVRRLFEVEIPEVTDRIIEVRSLAREAGYRSKVAVSCNDNRVDAVGACVGVRGSRIKSIVDELAGERIDIVRWNDSLQILVPNGLQPAEVEDVILCPMLGKVIVLVRDDQLSLAIGKKGQNVRLASKLVGWDIHVLTQERLDEQLDRSITAFSVAPGVDEELAENLVSQGFFTFDDLSVIEPDELMELGGMTREKCDAIVDYADIESLRIEEEEKIAAAERRRLARETPPTPPAKQPEPVAAEPVAAEPETPVEEARDETESESAAAAELEATDGEATEAESSDAEETGESSTDAAADQSEAEESTTTSDATSAEDASATPDTDESADDETLSKAATDE
jgi:N utilization substance protein A